MILGHAHYNIVVLHGFLFFCFRNYWKEIGIISVMLSVAVNLLLTQILPYVFSRNGQPISKASPQLTHSLFDSAEINAERSTVTPSTATGSTSKVRWFVTLLLYAGRFHN